VTLLVDIHIKFEVSSFKSSRDIEGSQNSKSRSRDPFVTPFDLILHFVSLVPLVNKFVPNLKFLVSPVPEIWRVAKFQK